MDTRLDLVTDCIAGFPEGIHTEEDEERSIPNVVKTGRLLVRNSRVNALLLSCAADPGLEHLRSEVNVPVVGAGSAVASFALLLDRPVGVLGIGDEPPRVIRKSLGEKLVGYARPEGVRTTFDIQEKRDEYVAAAGRLISENGARSILLACTGLSTARIASKLEKELDVPVIDPVIAAGILAYYLARRNIV